MTNFSIFSDTPIPSQLIRSLRCQPFHAASHPDTTPPLRWALGWAVPGGAGTLWAPFGCAGGTTWPPGGRCCRAPGVSGAPATVPKRCSKMGKPNGILGKTVVHDWNDRFLGVSFLGECWWLEMPAPACCFGEVVYHSMFLYIHKPCAWNPPWFTHEMVKLVESLFHNFSRNIQTCRLTWNWRFSNP